MATKIADTSVDTVETPVVDTPVVEKAPVVIASKTEVERLEETIALLGEAKVAQFANLIAALKAAK